MCSSQKFFIMPLEFQISQIILFFFSSEKHWVVELIEPDCLPLYEYGCMPCPRPPTRRKKRSHIYGRRGAWAVLQAVLPKLVERKVCVPRVRGRPACLWSVSRQCRFKPSVAGTLPLCSLIVVSEVSGVRTRLSGGKGCVYALWCPGIQKSTWMWITHLLDVIAMEENTQHIIPKQRKTRQRFDSASALPSPGCTPSPLRGQEVSGPALHPEVGGGWAYGGKLINSNVYVIKITLHQNASFVRTVIGPAERSGGEVERKTRVTL